MDTNQLDKLLPCPYCGGEAIYTDVTGYEMRGNFDSAWCRCGECDKVGIPFSVDFWNTRPIEDALRAEVARLTAELEAVAAAGQRDAALAISLYQELQQAREATCAWTKNEDDWDRAEWVGDCGATWVFEEGGPVENEMGYCPNCGKRLVVLPTPPEQEANG